LADYLQNVGGHSPLIHLCEFAAFGLAFFSACSFLVEAMITCPHPTAMPASLSKSLILAWVPSIGANPKTRTGPESTPSELRNEAHTTMVGGAQQGKGLEFALSDHDRHRGIA
jgi:hypothetical protein